MQARYRDAWHYAARRCLTASLLNSRLAISGETGIRESNSVKSRLCGRGTALSLYRLESTTANREGGP